MKHMKVLVLSVLCATSFLCHAMENKPTQEAIAAANSRLWKAVANDNLAEVEQIITEGIADVNSAKKDGNTPLMYAARDNNIDIINALIKAGADVNSVNHNGTTALICAAYWNMNVDIIHALINPSQKSFVRKKLETLLAIYNKNCSYLSFLPKEVLKIIITCMHPEEFTMNCALICSLHPQVLVDNIPLENLVLLVKDETLNQSIILDAWQKKINGISESLKAQKMLGGNDIQAFATVALARITKLLANK
jgi:hypothetical protein